MILIEDLKEKGLIKRSHRQMCAANKPVLFKILILFAVNKEPLATLKA